MTRQQWEARKDWQPDPDHDDPGSSSGLNFTFAIQYHKNLVLCAPHSGYGTLGGVGAFFGVVRYPLT